MGLRVQELRSFREVRVSILLNFPVTCKDGELNCNSDTSILPSLYPLDVHKNSAPRSNQNLPAALTGAVDIF